MNLSGQLEELEISFWRRVVRRRWRLVALVTMLFVGVTVSVMLVRPVAFSATTEVFVSGGDVAPEVEFIKSRHVVDEVSRKLGYVPEISVKASSTAWIMDVEAEGQSREEAVRAADVYATTYVRLREDAAYQAWRATIVGLQRSVEETQRQLNAVPVGDPDANIPRLERDLAYYQESLALAMTGSFTESRARPVLLSQAAVRPVGGAPTLLLYGLAAAMVGIVAGAGIAAIREGLNTRIDVPNRAAQVLRAPLLGTTRGANELLYAPPAGWRRRRRCLGNERLLARPGTPEAEALGLVRTRLLPMDSKKPRGAVQVCGVETADRHDAAVAAANLAQSFAHSGVPTALVWADFRHSAGILEVLGADPAHCGLAEVVTEECTLHSTMHQSADESNLWVLTSGHLPASVVDLVSGQRFRQTMDDLVAFVDVVVVFTPPLAEHPDGQLMAQAVDATVLVVNAQTHRGPLAQAEEDLRSMGVRVEGVIFAGPPES